MCCEVVVFLKNISYSEVESVVTFIIIIPNTCL